MHKDMMQRYPTLHVAPINLHLLALHGVVRSASTQQPEFSHHLHLLLQQLLSSALSLLPYTAETVTTPTQSSFITCRLPAPVVAVTVLRAGEAFEPPLRYLLPAVSIGKLLIQRDESSPSKAAALIYSKLPHSLTSSSSSPVLLLDVMLATGNSLIVAVQSLLERGVELDRLLVCCLISCETGIQRVMQRWPSLKLCVGWVDAALNEHCYILPGVGDAGDRYFDT